MNMIRIGIVGIGFMGVKRRRILIHYQRKERAQGISRKSWEITRNGRTQLRRSAIQSFALICKNEQHSIEPAVVPTNGDYCLFATQA